MRTLFILFSLLLFGSLHGFELKAQTCLPTRLEIGGEARVTPGASNRIRSEPSTGAEQIGQIPAGGIFTILDGSQCNDGFLWWQIAYGGVEGWTVEGNATDYFLEPYSDETEVTATSDETNNCNVEPRLQIDEYGQVSSTVPSRLRAGAGTSAEQVGQVDPDEFFLVIEGPMCADGFNWWQVEVDNVRGWLAEGDAEAYYVELVTDRSLLDFTPTPEPTLITYAISWNADGRRLAVATSNGIFIYNSEDWSQKPYLFAGGIRADDLGFSPSNPDLLVINSLDSLFRFRVYQLSDEGEDLIFEDELMEGPVGGDSSASNFAFRDDGTQLGFGGTSFEVFETENWTQINQVDIFRTDVGCCHRVPFFIYPSDLNATGDYGVGGIEDGIVQLFDLALPQPTNIDAPDPRLSMLDRGGRTQRITSLKFSPDGTHIIAGDETGSLQMWEIETGSRTSFIRSESQTSTSNQINDIAFYPDGTALATAESDPNGIVRVFTTEGLEPLIVFGLNEGRTRAFAVAYSPDGETLVAVVDDVIYLLDTSDYRVVERIEIE